MNLVTIVEWRVPFQATMIQKMDATSWLIRVRFLSEPNFSYKITPNNIGERKTMFKIEMTMLRLWGPSKSSMVISDSMIFNKMSTSGSNGAVFKAHQDMSLRNKGPEFQSLFA